LYLSPDRDVDCAMWHVRRIEYSIVVRLPRRGIEGFGPGPRSIVEGQDSVRFDILQKKVYSIINTRICFECCCNNYGPFVKLAPALPPPPHQTTKSCPLSLLFFSLCAGTLVAEANWIFFASVFYRLNIVLYIFVRLRILKR
jgi:hypothetical protein